MMAAGRRSKTRLMRSRISASGMVSVPKASTADRDGAGDADAVGDLQLEALGQAGRHDVLGHPACRVGRRAVHLGGVLAGEGAAAVPGHSRRRCRR